MWGQIFLEKCPEIFDRSYIWGLLVLEKKVVSLYRSCMWGRIFLEKSPEISDRSSYGDFWCFMNFLVVRFASGFRSPGMLLLQI